MDLDRLETFRAVAAERGFSRAAGKVFKTQPAVSQAIRSLEDELGTRLFERLGRTVELTEAGRILLEHTREAVGALDRARARIDALEGLQRGRVVVGTSDTTACYVLPPVLSAFRRRWPDVEIVLSNRPSPVTVGQVVAREVDLGVVTLPVSHAKIEAIELLAREDVLICSASHALAARKRVRLRELDRQPLLLLDKGASTRRFIDRQLRRAGVTPTIAMELASIEVIKKLVALGFGVSIVPRIAVEQEVARGELAAVPIFAARDARKLGVIHRKDGHLPPAADAFLAMLRPGAS